MVGGTSPCVPWAASPPPQGRGRLRGRPGCCPPWGREDAGSQQVLVFEE